MEQCKHHNDIIGHQAECKTNIKSLFIDIHDMAQEITKHNSESEVFRRTVTRNEQCIADLCRKVAELKNDSKGFVWGLIIVLFQIANILIALKK